MSDLFQKIKKESMITSIICIVFGVMFCIWPGTILVPHCRFGVAGSRNRSVGSGNSDS